MNFHREFFRIHGSIGFNLFRLAFSFLDLLVPKKKNLVICGSHDAKYANGNSRVLFEYLVENHPEFEVWYWLRDAHLQDNPVFVEQYGDHVLSNKRLASMWKFLRARFLTATHGTPDFHPCMFAIVWGRKKIIQLFHGTPCKGGCYAEKAIPRYWAALEAYPFQHIFAVLPVASKIAAYHTMTSFNVRYDKFLFSGQARNDHLVSGVRRADVRSMVDLPPDTEKVILYAPTFRRYAETEFFPFPDRNLDRLKKFLEEHKAVMLLRAHYVELARVQELEDHQRLFAFNMDRCHEVTDVLPDVDVLITDYSSIFYDYLLLDRPLIFLPYDLDEYQKRRVILYDDYDDWTPGAKPTTQEEFQVALQQAFSGYDAWGEGRKRVNKLMNFCQTGNTCECLVQWMAENA